MLGDVEQAGEYATARYIYVRHLGLSHLWGIGEGLEVSTDCLKLLPRNHRSTLSASVCIRVFQGSQAVSVSCVCVWVLGPPGHIYSLVLLAHTITDLRTRAYAHTYACLIHYPETRYRTPLSDSHHGPRCRYTMYLYTYLVYAR